MIEWKTLIIEDFLEIKLLHLVLFVFWVIIRQIDPARFKALCRWAIRNPFPKNLQRESNIRLMDVFSLANFLFLGCSLGLNIEVLSIIQSSKAFEWIAFLLNCGVILGLLLGRWIIFRTVLFLMGGKINPFAHVSVSNAALFRWGYLGFIGIAIVYYGGFSMNILWGFIALSFVYLAWLQLQLILKYFKQQQRSYLGFILYLCALKIIPWIGLYLIWSTFRA